MGRLILLMALLALPGLAAADEPKPVLAGAAGAPPATSTLDPEVEAHRRAGRLPVKLSLSASYRKLLITDVDPANDMLMLYGLGVSGRLFQGATAYLKLGLSERFVSVDRESGFLFRDVVLGTKVSTPIDLGGGRTLALSNVVAFYLPTSRASLNQDMYVAAQLRTHPSSS